MLLSSFALFVILACAAAEIEVPPRYNAGYASGFPPDNTNDQPFVCDYRKLAWQFGT